MPTDEMAWAGQRSTTAHWLMKLNLDQIQAYGETTRAVWT
jgi:hypothetical protein